MEEQIDVTEQLSEKPKNNLPPKITKEMLLPPSTPKHQALYLIKTIIYLLLSSFLVGFAAYALIEPNDFTIGGVSGIAILINVASNGKIPQSIILFTFNTPLVILAFFLVKKKFAILSLASITLQSLWLSFFENVFPDFAIAFITNGEKIFAAVAAGLCIGAAIVLAFKIGGSTGGADIAAVMIQRKLAANSIAWLLFFLNCTIIGLSIFVFYDKNAPLAYNLLPIMMAAFESYIESKTIDSLSNGMYSAIEFRIITDKPEEISNALMNELHRGTTLLQAQGMYTKDNHAMIVCVINKRQITTLKKIIKSVDPDCFAVMSHVSQVIGLGFYAAEN
jgi:uncharacterized membrane-anchored protein YitT (DUF2179 family)